FTGSSRLCFIGSSLLASGHSHVYVLLGFSFCYRYNAIKYSSPRSGFIISGLAVYLPNLLIHIFFAASPLLDSTELRRIVAEYHPTYDYEDRARVELLIGAEMNVPIKMSCLWFQCVILPVYAIIVIVSILVNRLLTSTLKMSEKSKQMHREIMKCLIFQAMLPLSYFVGIGIHIAQEKLLTVESIDIGHLIFTISAMTLSASPFSTLYFIQPYRM
ncbi:hypothetical protein PENTCL1PPCAC_16403, partial [Pristionchus entomophagus]